MIKDSDKVRYVFCGEGTIVVGASKCNKMLYIYEEKQTPVGTYSNKYSGESIDAIHKNAVVLRFDAENTQDCINSINIFIEELEKIKEKLTKEASCERE